MSDQPGLSGHQPGFDLSFRARLILSMCALVLLTGAIVFFVAIYGARLNIQALTTTLFQNVSSHAASQTQDFVLRAAPVAQSLEQLSNQGLHLDSPDLLAPQLLAFLKGNPGLTWVIYADETGRYVGATRDTNGQYHIEKRPTANGKTHVSDQLVLPDGSLQLVREDTSSTYDARTRPFYTLAKSSGQLTWTAPYMFFTQKIPGISCVIPVKNPDGSFRGVFSVEFDLNALSKFVTTLTVSENSRVFLFTPDQTLLAHPNLRNLTAKSADSGKMLTLADTGDPIVDAFRQHLQPAHLQRGSSLESDDFHFFPFMHADTRYLASTTVFSIGGGQTWIVGAVAPESDFLAGVWRTRLLYIAAAAFALLLAVVLAAITARRFSRPIRSVITFMNAVGAGDLDARADFKGGLEFRLLSNALNNMLVDLRERLLLRNSLKIAMDVQQSLLPASDPVSPLLDISGKSHYCDQTGGDYYDFIDVTSLAPDSLLIAVADVMGHGLPSALVMATARAALRTCAQKEQCLAQIMTRTNQVLSADNRHKRFVTLSLLLIDAQSRQVRWASAGHDPALVFNPASGLFTELEGGDIPLGLMEGTLYEEYISTPLPENAVMVIGTDGVWEMFNENKKQYGKARLQAVIHDNHTKTAAQIGAALEADLKAYRGKANPIDDVTFVIIKFLPPT
jgi:phosphoserine phosphatase RsbU/P